MPHSSYLTRDELFIADAADIDLAVGYPDLVGPAWLTDLRYERSVSELTEMFLAAHPDVPPGKGHKLPAQRHLVNAALLAACEFLGFPSALATTGAITYTGSHALERVITACLAGRSSSYAVTTEPSIDIITAMMAECNVPVRHVLAPDLASCPNVADIVDAARSGCALVVVSSPENPTGATYDAAALVHLANELEALDVPLLVDQSFLKVSPFAATAALPSLVAASGRWAFMWDTGKTMPMADDKLGFVFTGSDLYPLVAHKLEVLQCTLPAPKLMLFTLALRKASAERYCRDLSATVASNLTTLEDVFAESRVRVLRPAAGAFALLQIDAAQAGLPGTDLADSVLRDAGVGVVGGERFFYTSPPDGTILRVATARDPELFSRGAERLRTAVEQILTRRGGSKVPRAAPSVVRGRSRAVPPRPVAVIGAGITGLSCAHDLSNVETVEVFHDSGLLESTSAIATAIWHVYLVDPDDTQHLDWSSRTLLRLLDLRNDSTTGISLCKGVELFRTTPEHRPAWADLLESFRPMTPTELERFPGRTWGYEIEAPTANMDKYLPWLYEQCLERGVRFRRETVPSLTALTSSHDVVVNCAGLRATALCDDPELYPVRGQYLVLEPGETILEAYVGDDEHPGGMAYAIPRDGELLVGGTEEPYVAGMAFEADVDDMLTRAGEFLSVDLGALERKRSVVGLRPCRTSRHVRFGWDPEIPQVFHNYGHGGSGFSLAWGCAEDVTRAVAVARQQSGNRNAGSERQ